MKRLATVLILTLLLAGTLQAGENTTNRKIQRTNFKATFIELGSVNCVPCRMMQPVMKQVESDYRGVVRVVFYDVWTPEHRSKASEYGIRAIPTQIFLDQDGKEFYRHLGFLSAEEIGALLANRGIKKNPARRKK
jgi:thioredoxin 1